MPESLEEIATCALYEPTAQREAVLAREIIALREQVATNDAEIDRRLCAVEDAVRLWLRHSESLFARITALESAGARGEGEPHAGSCQQCWDERSAALRARDEAVALTQEAVDAGNRLGDERDALQQQLAERDEALRDADSAIRTQHYGIALQVIADALAATTPTASGS